METVPSTAKQSVSWILIVFLILLALAVRIPLVFLSNGDVDLFLIPWYDYIVAHGGFHALADNFSNYSPFYTYFLVLITYLPFIPKIVAIKSISILFDFIAAGFARRILSHKTPYRRLQWAVYFAILFSPVVLFDSAFWGQCDVIYTAFLLGFIFFMLEDRPLPAMLSFSLAFSIKFQAVFIAPLILALLLRRKIPWTYLLVPALVYFVVAIPAWIAGRSIIDLMTIYLQQGEFYRFLSLHAPNFYRYLPNELYDTIVPIGMGVAALTGLLLALALTKSRVALEGGLFLQVCTLVVLLMPFVLPKMHERYFFAAAVIAVPLAFYRPKFRLIPMFLQVALLMSFLPFFKGYPDIVLDLAMIFYLIVILQLSVATYRELFPKKGFTAPQVARAAER